jgi:hypothetical protein
LQTGEQVLAADQYALGIPGANPNLPGTGHSTRFMNYSHYFGTQGGRAVLTNIGANVPTQTPLFARRTAGQTGPPPLTGAPR